MSGKTGTQTAVPAQGEPSGDSSAGDVVTIPGDPQTNETPVQPSPVSSNGGDGEHMFTAEQVEAIRRQEKDKLYNKIDSMEQQLAAFNADREEQQRAAREAQETADAERKAREEEEMSAKDLLARKEDEFQSRLNTAQQEWEQRFNDLQEQNAAQAAVLEQERRFQELDTYRNRRLGEESENIMPDLIDFVRGNTEDEIEAAISTAIAKTSAIVESIQQVIPQERTPVRGIPATGSTPIGPLENATEQQTLTPQDIQSMSMEQYAQVRDRLLAAASSRR